MEHWASTVIEVVDTGPKTPPPSPAMSPQATSAGRFDAHSLPPDQIRTIDIELGRMHATASTVYTDRVRTQCAIESKNPACTVSEGSLPTGPATWRLYAALLAGLFQQCLSNGLIMTYGTILSYFTIHLLRSTNSTKLSLIGALPPFVRILTLPIPSVSPPLTPPQFLLALALPFGSLLDRGHHRRLNICAAFLVTVSLFSLAFTTQRHNREIRGRYYAVLLCAVPLGLGQSIFFLSSSHVARTWLPRRTGVALGVVNAGAALGGSVFPLVGAWSVPWRQQCRWLMGQVFTALTKRHSFQLAIFTLAAIAAALSVFIICFAVPHPQNFTAAVKQPTGRPKHMHLLSEELLQSFRSSSFIVFVASACIVYAGVLSVCFPFPLFRLLNQN